MRAPGQEWARKDGRDNGDVAPKRLIISSVALGALAAR